MDEYFQSRRGYGTIHGDDQDDDQVKQRKYWRFGRAAIAGICLMSLVLIGTRWSTSDWHSEDGPVLSAERLFWQPEVRAKYALSSSKRKQFLFHYEEELPPEVSTSMNFSVDPCSNFYEHVCGTWIQYAEIPPESGSVSRSWDGAQNRVSEHLREIFEAEYPEGAHPPGYPKAYYTRLHDWYQSCMDLDYIEELGASPLQPILSQIDSIQTQEDLDDVLAYLYHWNIPTFFAMNVGVGIRNRHKNSLFIDANGIMLPDYTYYPVDYYASLNVSDAAAADAADAAAAANGTNTTSDEDDDIHRDDREELRKYYIKIVQYAGYSADEAIETANATIETETMLAQWMLDEPYNASNTRGPEPINLTTLQSTHPRIPWTRLFADARAACAARGLTCAGALFNDSDVILLEAPYFYTKLSESLAQRPPSYWIKFLRSHVVYNLGPLLSQKFLQAGLEFDSYLSSVESLPPRWQKCVAATTNGLSALSDLRFLELYFPDKAHADGMDMLLRIKSVFIQDLREVAWMDDTTKSRALRKAELMALNLGSPVKYEITDYPVSARSYFNNSGWTYHVKLLRMLASLDRPVEEGRWNMRASTVNAYYDNAVNALFVPAGIMQPPFFNDSYSMSQNFGGIGAIMGHEMTHGFDNTGSQFNEAREMEDWWDPEVVKQFQVKTKCIADLYDNFRIADTQVGGNVTLGENIADFGGIKMAYKAYIQWYNETHGTPSPPSQELRLFFITFGQLWCDKERYKSLRLSVDSDVHSPNPFRTNGVVSQNADFAVQFGCPAGSPMNPVHKCVLWGDTQKTETLAAARQRRRARASSARRRD